MFNFYHVTLDGDTQGRLVGELEARGAVVTVAQTSPAALVDALLQALSRASACACAGGGA